MLETSSLGALKIIEEWSDLNTSILLEISRVNSTKFSRTLFYRREGH